MRRPPWWPSNPFLQNCLSGWQPQPGLEKGIIPPQLQGLDFAFPRLNCMVFLARFSSLLWSLWMVTQWYHSSQFWIICKPAVDALYATVQATDKEVKQQTEEMMTGIVFFQENPEGAQRTEITAKLSWIGSEFSVMPWLEVWLMLYNLSFQKERIEEYKSHFSFLWEAK